MTPHSRTALACEDAGWYDRGMPAPSQTASSQTASSQTSPARRSAKLPLLCATIAVLLFAVRFASQSRIDLGLQDEGFLWYGAQAVLRGDVPLVDFRSYDPGRYYASAAMMAAFGDGIVAMRAALSVVGAFGLFLGLLAATRATSCRWVLLLVGLILMAWMQPRWKVFEPTFAMGSVWLGVRLVERASRGRALAAGLWIGIAAVFGRNLGVYAGLGLFAVLLYEAWKLRTPGLVSRLGSLALGVLAGYLPMLAMMAFVPGFFDAFVDGLTTQVESGRANLARGAPLPWSVDYTGATALESVQLFLTGVAFLLLPIVYVGGLVLTLRAPRAALERSALLPCAVLVGTVFAHHVSVRSDLFHLAQCYAPLLLACFALPRLLREGKQTWPIVGIALGFGILTLTSITQETPWVRRSAAARAGSPYVTRAVAGDELALSVRMAEIATRVPAVVDQLVPADEALFIAPHRPALYPMLGRPAPTWDTYLSEPASDAHQERMLRELADVRWALTHRVPPGPGNQLGLPASNPRVWALLQEEFERVDAPLPNGHFLWRRR